MMVAKKLIINVFIFDLIYSYICEYHSRSQYSVHAAVLRLNFRLECIGWLFSVISGNSYARVKLCQTEIDHNIKDIFYIYALCSSAKSLERLEIAYSDFQESECVWN